jgi:CubicO group peptidase (beta-lactamase class C family)
VSPADRPLDVIRTWDTPACAGYRLAPSRGASRGDTEGPTDRVFPWASVTKVVTALATWIAVEEGVIGWDQPAGPPGSTLRHLLAHASGLAPDGDQVLAPPGRARIYSNRGIEVAAEHVAAAAAMAFDEYAREAVLAPLGMTGTTLANPAAGASGPLVDLLALAGELLHPTLIAPATLAEATSAAFPGLRGVLPGFGSQPDNAWGLGVEIRDHKDPHWTGRRASPRTFGHFGRSGSFIWVDPDAGVAAATLAERPFGPWAARAWPDLSDGILAAAGGGDGT